MIPKIKYRISFWFKPNEKPINVHIDYIEFNDNSVQDSFISVAKNRYPNTFNEKAPLITFQYPVPNQPARLHIGDPANINARYLVQFVLAFGDKYFELKELPA